MGRKILIFMTLYFASYQPVMAEKYHKPRFILGKNLKVTINNNTGSNCELTSHSTPHGYLNGPLPDSILKEGKITFTMSQSCFSSIEEDLIYTCSQQSIAFNVKQPLALFGGATPTMDILPGTSVNTHLTVKLLSASDSNLGGNDGKGSPGLIELNLVLLS